MDGTIIWQRAEGAVIFLTGIWIVAGAGTGPWWWSLLLFFAPDISFAAYALGPRVGAFTYNLVHNYGFGLIVLVGGMVLGLGTAIWLGALWFAHCGLDRMLGYGLKSTRGFSYTHLGRIGRGR
ncbi:MAG: DUF4260 domain-containing protein [Paracoccus sp. (in: a-proteobacteria)]|nr:DUF4260 domain-containing protein [Paracoccus sp. (in: a-proteobacteria)]